jgi:hypothetical protein
MEVVVAGITPEARSVPAVRRSPSRHGRRRGAGGGVRGKPSLVLSRLGLDRVGDLPGRPCLRAVHASPRPAELPQAQSIVGFPPHRATEPQQPRGAG